MKPPLLLAAVALVVALPAAAGEPSSSCQEKLTSPAGAELDFFGDSVSISGTTAVVGANGADVAAFNAGAAFVFVESGSEYEWQATLTAGDAAGGDFFGTSVAISGDTIVAGAYGDGVEVGAAYVFARVNGSWVQRAKLRPVDLEENDEFGRTVAVSGDVIAVSAPNSDDSPFNAGALYVFARFGDTWILDQKLQASDLQQSDRFGQSIAVLGDTIVVGVPDRDDAGNGSGAAYVFVRDAGGTWSETAKLTASDAGPGDQFGYSVSADADTLLVGAPGDAGFTGAAYVFERIGGAWTETRKLLAAGGVAGDDFGRSVAISGDRALVGAPRRSETEESSGVVIVYERNGGDWIEVDRCVGADTGPNDFVGISLGCDGDRGVAGAGGDRPFGLGSGSAYVFGLGADRTPPAIFCPGPIALEASDARLEVRFSVVALDFCDPSPAIVASPRSRTLFPPGESLVGCVATDADGNAATCAFTVTISPRLDFDADADGPLSDGTRVDDLYLGLGVRVTGLSDTGLPGAFARQPGPPDSSRDDFVPVTLPNYLQTSRGDDSADSGTITFEFVDPDTGAPAAAAFARLAFLDVERSGAGPGGRSRSRLEAFDADGSLIGRVLVPVGPDQGQFLAVIGSAQNPLEIARLVAVVGDASDAAGLDGLAWAPVARALAIRLVATSPDVPAGTTLRLHDFVRNAASSGVPVTFTMRATTAPARPGIRVLGPFSGVMPPTASRVAAAFTHRLPIPANKPQFWDRAVIFVATLSDPDDGAVLAESSATVTIRPPGD